VHSLLLHWLPMAVVTTAVLWCAASLWGRTSPRLFQLPILRKPSLRKLLAVVFGLPLLVPTDQFYIISVVALASLMVAALAVLRWSVSLRLVAIGGLVTTGFVWGIWTNRLTADILALALILAVLNLTIQISLSFWAWSWFGILHVGYDIFTNYIVDTQTAGAQDAVVHASPMVLVFGSVLGSLDVAIPGAIIMVAATVAYRHRRMAVLYGGLTGYVAGFAACEVVFLLSGRGVAAMMTLVPATIAGILLPAWRTGLLSQLSPMATGTTGGTTGADTGPATADTQTVLSRTEPS
jgi:hypothetical protein